MADSPTPVNQLTTIDSMDLTPKRIEEVEFRGSIRGYDRNEVDDFLDRVAAGFGRLQNQLTEAVDRATRAEERMAQLEEQLRTQPAQAEPTPVVRVDPDLAADSAVQAAHRTLHLAQRTADAAVAEAREEADRMLTDARAEAERLTMDAREEAERLTIDASTLADRMRREAAADIEEQAEQARWKMAAEVDELEHSRSSLLADIEVLDGHLRAHGDQIRRTLEALQRGLDDPASLRFPPPEGLGTGLATPIPVTRTEEPADLPAPTTSPVDWSQPVVEFEPGTDPVEDDLGYDAGQPADPAELGGFPPEPTVRVDGAPPRSYPEWLFTVDGQAGQAGRPGYPAPAAEPAPAMRDEDANGGRPAENGNGEIAAEDEDQFLAELRTAMTDDDGQQSDEHAPWLPSSAPAPPPPPPVETDAERWRFDRGR
jgi:DivIVA domain-containing protein